MFKGTFGKLKTVGEIQEGGGWILKLPQQTKGQNRRKILEIYRDYAAQDHKRDSGSKAKQV